MKNLEIKKEIFDKIKFSDEYCIYVWAWCEYSNDTYNTWGEISLEIDGDFTDFYCIDKIDYDKDINDLTTEELKNIKKELKKTYKYLEKHFENVKIVEDIQWV